MGHIKLGIPVWTKLSEAKEVIHIDFLYFCKQPYSSVPCKYTKTNLKGSLVCKCRCRRSTYFTYQVETSSSIFEHVAKIATIEAVTHLDHDAVGGRLLVSTWLPVLASCINSLTAGCAYTLENYTSACVFKEHKACYGRAERKDLRAS